MPGQQKPAVAAAMRRLWDDPVWAAAQRRAIAAGFAAKHGKPPARRKRYLDFQIHVYLDEDTYDAFRAYARKKGVGLSELGAEAITKFLEDHGALDV